MDNHFDLVCLSHLRWDFVYQRPHHLMSRFARDHRVFFVEEPVFDAQRPHLDLTTREGEIEVVVPHLPADLTDSDRSRQQSRLLADLLDRKEVRQYLLWYYTPMAIECTRHLAPLGVIYDCMDELSMFDQAPPALKQNEQRLLEGADLVFTGGHSLYEAKRWKHPSVYCFPSGVDVRHFSQGRRNHDEPWDQAIIPTPRIGFYGVIDERLDLKLIAGIADARPDWQLVIIGPIAEAKLDSSVLPHRRNIHYLGGKSYHDLPVYLSGWDVAFQPFARNQSTRFISPTKTPEYLASGRPVVSTSIRDVVTPYGEQGLVRIADSVPDTVVALQAALDEDSESRWPRIDAFLRDMSWDRTWTRMSELVDEVVGVSIQEPEDMDVVSLSPIEIREAELNV